MTKAEAFALLTAWTKSPSLVGHALAVEAAMRVYARRFGEDEERWGLTGLLHDFDYERHPTADLHPEAGSKTLREHGVPEDVIYAILTHAEYLNLPRNSLMDKTLFAVDELCGFLVAVALVRPSKSLLEVEVSSVKKKMKDKAFARAVRREDIVEGAETLGLSLDDHIGTTLTALQGIAGALGLKGVSAPSAAG